MFTKAIESEQAPKAIGPYSPAVEIGDFIYLSGQLPLDPKTGVLVDEDIRTQTRQSLENMRAVLMEMGLDMRHIVKTTVFMADLEQFDAMNEIYGSYFIRPYPARSCVQVAKLPKGALVEIEALAIDTLKYEKAVTGQSCSGCCSSSEDDGEGCCAGGCCGG